MLSFKLAMAEELIALKAANRLRPQSLRLGGGDKPLDPKELRS